MALMLHNFALLNVIQGQSYNFSLIHKLYNVVKIF